MGVHNYEEEFNKIVDQMKGPSSANQTLPKKSFFRDFFSSDSIYRTSVIKVFIATTLIVTGFAMMVLGVQLKATILGVVGFFPSLAGVVWYVKIRKEHKLAKKAHESLVSSGAMLNS